MGKEKDNIIDFQTIKAVSELEAELSGVFGITQEDIQKAAERLLKEGLKDPRESLERLSPALKNGVPHLDILKSLAEDYAYSGDQENLNQIKEVMRHYYERINAVTVKK